MSTSHRRPDAPPAKGAGRVRAALTWNTRAPSRGPLSLSIKNHFVAMVGEFVGTTLFLFIAFGGTNVANIPTTSVTGDTTAGQDGTAAAAPNTSNLLYIALSFGFSLAVCAWIFFRISGGLFNPAISWAMMLCGAITPLRAALLTFAQILGGIAGAALVHGLLPGTLNVRTLLAPGVSIVRGLWIEAFLAALLTLTVLLLAAEKHKATFLAPIGIGLALFVAELLGVFYTGGSLNPARSFGPAVVLRTFSGYHWIYHAGPIIGATMAAGFYRFIKYLEYETVLGPEEDDSAHAAATAAAAVAKSTQLPAPPATMLGSTAAGPSRGDAQQQASTANTTSMGEKPVSPAAQDGRVAVQGPGLADLLTTGPAHAVYSLPQPVSPTGEYEARLGRIEALLEQLVGGRGAADGRKWSAEGTVVEEEEGPRHEWRRQSEYSHV
ncbi:hypothetical protein JCM10450v2_002951 [Rhodotorula kratochvilovae]